ncbi:putative B3 domain-containing protein Os08g0325100 isoform X1 [Rhodamnia argentea]|uniref:B3 domain-containing protein Os08g0325100 isoform X1 n=1 Tax=Rhodamnia argentea TaxID=178133 RepID=A0ABM3HD91_9MYRT|nr:putative B3 domain-containing protein Os08g0325100 isoform X1 [Rhodamnia argentea]
MAFSRRRRREEGAVEPEIVAGPCLEGRHFFKIILSDTLESGKLGIPKSFLRRCGKDLSNSVLLQVPAGSTWTIELEKRNNDMVSLWKGWREFMEYYSVGHGHLIVFEYKGNSTFCVIIFNKSASEIDYSLSSSRTSYLGRKFTSPKTEDVVEAEDLTSHRRMRVEPHLPYPQLSPIYSPRGSKVFHGPTPLATPELANEFDSEHPFFKLVIPGYQTRKMVRSRFLSTTGISKFNYTCFLNHASVLCIPKLIWFVTDTYDMLFLGVFVGHL